MKIADTYTYRYAAVGVAGQVLNFPFEVQEVTVHIEGSTVVATLLGNRDGSTAAQITSDGTSISLPGGRRNHDLWTVAAPSGTIDVSILAWR